MTAAPEVPSSSAQSWGRRALPFVVAAALVAVAVGRIDRAAFVDALARVHVGGYVGFTVGFVIALLAADSFATVLIYRGAVAPIPYRDFVVLRGASYLPSLLNHHVGQAFLTVALSRAYGVSLARVAGATLLVYASWVGCLLLLAAAAFHLRGMPLGWSALALAPGVVYLAVLVARPAALARTRLLAPLFEAGMRGHLVALGARIPHFLVLFVGTWAPFWFFEVRIPVGAALALVPVLMVVVTLPITPQGLGTRDVVAAALFEQFAAGASREERLAAITACTASWVAVITLVEAALGLALLRAALPRVLRAQAKERLSTDGAGVRQTGTATDERAAP